jgi:UDP-galactopyranose mutase
MVDGFDHVFYSGPIDDWFDFNEGRLGYRTLDFVTERYDGDYQGNAVINYCDQDIPWTRISEHKHFAYWEGHKSTIIYKEFSRNCTDSDTPYYPIRMVNDKAHLSRYVDKARTEKKITFVGRLGTYRYLDMHITIAEALDVARCFIETCSNGSEMPSFMTDPLV